MSLMRDSRSATDTPLYFCLGGAHTLTIKALADSPWINQGASLNDPSAAGLPFTATPKIAEYTPFAEDGLQWSIACDYKPATAAAETYEVWIQTEFTAPAHKVAVSQGHHRLEFVETRGNEQFLVLAYEEKTLLSSKVISHYTRDGIPIPVNWILDGETLDVSPSANGITTFEFNADKTGVRTFTLTAPSLYFERGTVSEEIAVEVLAVTPWGSTATLQVNEKPVAEVAKTGVVLLRGQDNTLTLLNPDERLKGSQLTLFELTSDSVPSSDLGLVFNPPLGTPTPLDGANALWRVTSSGPDANRGLFSLGLKCSKLQRDWQPITARVISQNLADEIVKVEVDGRPVTDTTATFFSGENKPLTLTFEPWMVGLQVALEEVGDGARVSAVPPLKALVEVPDDGRLTWQITAGAVSAAFRLNVSCPLVPTPRAIDSRVVSKLNMSVIESIKVGGASIDLQTPNLVFFRAQPTTLEVKFKDDAMIGMSIVLDPGDGDSTLATVVPGVGEANGQVIGQNKTLIWTVTGAAAKSGYFGYQFRFLERPDVLPLPCRLLSKNLADEADVKIANAPVPAGGNVFFRGVAQTLTLTPKAGSPLAGYPVTLTCSIKTGLDPANVTSVPALSSAQTAHSWAITGATKSGTFQLTLKGQGMTTPITLAVSKLLSSRLADEARFQIDGNEATNSEVLYLRDATHTISLTPNSDSPLAGLEVSLQWVRGSGVVAEDLTCTPTWSSAQTAHSWAITGATKSGTFQLILTGQGMSTPINVAISKLLSPNLADEAWVQLDEADTPATDITFLRNMSQIIRLVSKNGSLLDGLTFKLNYEILSGLPPQSVTSIPLIDSITSRAEWNVRCQNNGVPGRFRISLHCLELHSPIHINSKRIEIDYSMQ